MDGDMKIFYYAKRDGTFLKSEAPITKYGYYEISELEYELALLIKKYGASQCAKAVKRILDFALVDKP